MAAGVSGYFWDYLWAGNGNRRLSSIRKDYRVSFHIRNLQQAFCLPSVPLFFRIASSTRVAHRWTVWTARPLRNTMSLPKRHIYIAVAIMVRAVHAYISLLFYQSIGYIAFFPEHLAWGLWPQFITEVIHGASSGWTKRDRCLSPEGHQ